MITIIGNGESRKNIDISKINGIKVGCNAIYLYENVDLICAMDKFWRDKICEETKIPLISRHNNTVFQPMLELYKNGTWTQTGCKYRGYCSGTTALDFMCHYFKDDVYLIGFDFGYKGKYVNHIYKDTQNHPKSNRPAQNENIFLNETLEIIKRYPKHNIVWVSDTDFSIKINRISVEDYKNDCCG